MTGTPESIASVAGGKAAARRFAFAGAVLDERTLELLVQGEPVELEPKPLEVLRHLLTHAGEVVTKDEILAAVWPGRILSETVLTKCIARLREVLRDDEQQIIKTVHGYGYRLVAPVRVDAAAPPASAPRFDFKPGDHPPLRPLWSLVESLGQGSHGEAWLVRHDKTREQRVYKFATDGAALHALKREITLYRLLHDALGDTAPCIAALDWNLDEAPYFLELEYAPGGSLVDWAQARNGLAQVPLPVRIEIAAQAAEALAAAHSMGVLHKDLKPSNILIVSAPDSPVSIKLGDFGSGGVLDPGRLEAMGITQMGFTQTIKAGTLTGTPLYLAPEVISGQPVTVQADIFSLGVILYQLIVGDLWRPLAPGWEQDIGDELLREDIAYAVEGHVERRLGTAQTLAQRLRNLDRRREQRAAERAEKSEAEAQRMEMVRMRARRGWVRATMAVLAAGLTASIALSVIAFRARNDAAESAATSKAVSDFLSQDMFAQVSANKPLRSLTVKEVMDAAAAQVPVRFADRPAAAAQVHNSLGASYLALDDVGAAEKELDTALRLAEQNEVPGSDTALDAVTGLVLIKFALGKLSQEKAHYQAVLAAGTERLGPAHLQVLKLRAQFAFINTLTGKQQEAAAELRRVLSEAEAARLSDESFLAETETNLGLALLYLAEYAEAAEVLGQVIERQQARFGRKHLSVANARMRRGLALLSLGRYAETESELAAALEGAQAWTPSDAQSLVLDIRTAQGRLRMEQGRLDEAAKILEAARDTMSAWKGPEGDLSYLPRRHLAEVYLRMDRPREAEAELRQALQGAERALGPSHERVARIRIILAEVLLRQNRRAEAWAEFRRVDFKPLEAFPQHPALGEARRVEGLLRLADGDRASAHRALTEAVEIFERRFGTGALASRRARDELAAIPAAGSKP